MFMDSLVPDNCFYKDILFNIGEHSNNSIYNYERGFTGSLQLFYKDNWRTFKYFYLPQTGVAVASLRGAGRL